MGATGDGYNPTGISCLKKLYESILVPMLFEGKGTCIKYTRFTVFTDHYKNALKVTNKSSIEIKNLNALKIVLKSHCSPLKQNQIARCQDI